MEIVIAAMVVIVSILFFKNLGTKALPIVIILILACGFAALIGAFGGIDILQ